MRQGSDEALTASPSLELYFSEQLSEHGQRLRPPPNEDTLWYLSMLLTRFSRSDALFAYDAGEYGLRPLALLYGDALEAEDDQQRCLFLQQLGDMALFLGALFPDRFSRRGIRQDYIVGMGGGAYDYLAGNARANRHVFAELGAMFGRLLELVSAACSAATELSNETVLSIYRRWAQTGDPLLARQLRQLGITVEDSARVH